MNKEILIKILNKDIYPAISNCMNEVLPEFNFIEKGSKWISTNTLHLSGLEGQHGKGKVTVSKDKPYVIGDWREGTIGLTTYLEKSAFHSNIVDFETAVKYLASITGTEIDGAKINAKDYESKKVYKRKSKPKFDIIPPHYVEASFKNYEQNNFIVFLEFVFGVDATNKALNTYLIGTSSHQFTKKGFRYKSPKGATIFWQIDTSKKVRTGRIMLFNSITGNRIKSPFTHVTWAHSIMKYKKFLLEDFVLGQCFFGEHLLLKKTHKKIGIVESEKTAVIMSILMPELYWLASGGNWGISKERFTILSNREVILYPDLGQYDHWKKKANDITNCSISVSDLIENKATTSDRKNGFDIADYLLKNIIHEKRA